jgi:lysophospholipase L1-like esterase
VHLLQILIYSDSGTWGIIPLTRRRLPFHARWPGVMELALNQSMDGPSRRVRVIEDCLNGRRTAWDDPFKPGRNGLAGVQQRIEIHSPLALVMLMLGNNDLQSTHVHRAWHVAQGTAALIDAIRRAPIEPGMPVPPILVIAPPPIQAPRGPLAPKFMEAPARCVGLAAALREVASLNGCHFFDAAAVTTASTIDGIHFDADQHLALGTALAAYVATLPLIDAEAAA